MSGFEGSFLGDSARIDPGAVLECGVCWWVYDPTQGDDAWQIPAGTPFAELPAHWRCPACDSPPEQFMVLGREQEKQHARHRPKISASRQAIRHREHQLLEAFTAIDERMRTLPVYNPRLDIRVIGLQQWQEEMVGIAATPWCMNIVLLPPEEASPRLEGSTREVNFPSGSYTFVAGELPGAGPVESCSLFSPMEQFDDPAVVAEVARHAILELMREPEPLVMSRRSLLRGRGSEQSDRGSNG